MGLNTYLLISFITKYCIPIVIMLVLWIFMIVIIIKEKIKDWWEIRKWRKQERKND